MLGQENGKMGYWDNDNDVIKNRNDNGNKVILLKGGNYPPTVHVSVFFEGILST